jgi:Rad3-related DNA helicase
MRYRAESDPEMYAWMAIRLVVQAAGRVCRAPDDEGITIILDSDLKRLYSKYEHLFPAFFRDALTMED